jgi:replication-associated recombination protein RarA
MAATKKSGGGAFMLKTPSDYPFDEATSSMQKCIRRNLPEPALFFAAELEERFPDYLWQRLTIIVNEDIGIASPETIMLIATLREQYYLVRTKPRGTSERLVLATAILAMCRCPKTRASDDLQSVVWRRRAYEGWKPEVPDVALDKHTKRGRRMGRGLDHWQAEGTKLANEAPGLNPWVTEAWQLRERYETTPPKPPRGQSGNPEDATR